MCNPSYLRTHSNVKTSYLQPSPCLIHADFARIPSKQVDRSQTESIQMLDVGSLFEIEICNETRQVSWQMEVEESCFEIGRGCADVLDNCQQQQALKYQPQG